MYKENTILVEPWTPGARKDRWLLECINIADQLRISSPTDVRKVLHSIIDIQRQYRR